MMKYLDIQFSLLDIQNSTCGLPEFLPSSTP